MNQISISNIAWDTSLDEKVAQRLSSMGIRCIDIAPGKYFQNFKETTDNQISIVRKIWEDRGFSIIGMQSLLYGTKGLNLFAEREIQQRMLEHLDHVCRIGSILGATKLVFGSPKNRDRTGLNDILVEEIALQFFYQLGEIAKKNEVVICLEPNPSCYGANFLTGTWETYSFVSKLNHPNIKLQFDSGAFFINKESVDIVDQVKDLIGHVHISEPNLSVLGTEKVDHHLLGEKLEECHFSSPRTIEILTNKSQYPLEDIVKSVHVAKLNYS